MCRSGLQPSQRDATFTTFSLLINSKKAGVYNECDRLADFRCTISWWQGGKVASVILLPFSVVHSFLMGIIDQGGAVFKNAVGKREEN